MKKIIGIVILAAIYCLSKIFNEKDYYDFDD